MFGYLSSKKYRCIAWSAAGAAVVASAGIVGQTPVAAADWPKQKTYTGQAFDTCATPSRKVMKAWKGGRYGAAAVYIGGRNRACAQPNLTRSWVKSVHSMGWKLIPVYVGVQPNCKPGSAGKALADSAAASKGTKDAKDAVAKTSALGMKKGSPIFLDMEPAAGTKPSCNDLVLKYVRAFTKELRSKTYRAGFYGPAATTAKAVATASNRKDLPGNLWYALWNKKNTTTADWPYKKSLYKNHSRGHQYMRHSKETRRGHALTVDRNAWDAPVAIIG
ncbi:glycoside hydrolase domain-containing protein [Streptomyces sp. NPDC059785]|uniref:glycoside hydrolase domain-containing protein n=1 Tax=unclassified Streptomyces TaxID=2593676 RepID=UPI003657EFD9